MILQLVPIFLHGMEKEVFFTKLVRLNGAIIGSINPNKHQSFPIVFHIPYFDMVYPVRKPYPLKVQVAAFAHKILTFNSEKTLDPHQSIKFRVINSNVKLIERSLTLCV